ncbi:M15 family metallopeptidase [Fulvivirga maritima]|uniref:M15 family metallopeptidase n=1 Tax=Fulvivirga maritima TaxID=2904247 RepID=UPI001F1939A0|nr:M15 family metallopeptidase [Fulvivirga maritima]UII28303.1 M15 family metallopeptidase [Fulvivirga maritima]
MTYNNLKFITLVFCLISCGTPQKEEAKTDEILPTTDSMAIEEEPEVIETPKEPISDTAFVVLKDYASGFFYDMKYATEDNFLKKAVYDCPDCMIRKEVADGLIQVNDSLSSKGYHIKFFDCYRPLDVQKAMWKIYPNAKYVANPYTTGSIHNKGGAVDITLVDDQGNELDMGTGFDFFGEEAHHAYQQLPDTVLNNRKLLKSTMEAFGFNAIRTEWWHYNYTGSSSYKVSNFKTECD